MEGSEYVALLVSIAFGGGMWWMWLQRLLGVTELAAKPGRRWIVPTALGAFMLVTLGVLRTLAASDVRDDPRYVAFYMILGLGVSGLAPLGLRLFGIRPSDISERGNHAAAVFVVLATLASAFAYAGANIGEGPGFHVVLLCALLADAGLFAILVLHAALARTAYRILVDRDAGAALRVGLMLVACGISLGRAVGGSWVDLRATLVDFGRYSWPAVVICAVDLAVARATASREPSRLVPADVAVGLLHLVLSIVFLHVVGMPA